MMDGSAMANWLRELDQPSAGWFKAFAALAAGADGLKLFPAEAAGPAVIKALRAVLPWDCDVFAVGGVEPSTMAAYHAAGATGFGIGSSLYAPGRSADDVHARAHAFVDAWAALAGG